MSRKELLACAMFAAFLPGGGAAADTLKCHFVSGKVYGETEGFLSGMTMTIDLNALSKRSDNHLLRQDEHGIMFAEFGTDVSRLLSVNADGQAIINIQDRDPQMRTSASKATTYNGVCDEVAVIDFRNTHADRGLMANDEVRRTFLGG